MNDITGADVRCPKCNITYLTPAFVNRKLFMYCCCGYGKKEYFKAVEKAKKQK